MPQPTLVVFDLDGTLIDTDCAQEWLTFLKHLDFPNAAETETNCREIMQCYASGHMDMSSYMLHWITPILGYPISELEKLSQEFADLYIKPRIFEEGLSCVHYHRQQGDTLVLVSASPSLLVKPIARLLGIEHVIGIEIAVSNNTLQPRLLTPLSFRADKITCLKQWLYEQQLSNLPLSIAYSDSINDAPLLEFAKSAVVVNGDKTLKTLAHKKQWLSVNWTQHLRSNALQHCLNDPPIDDEIQNKRAMSSVITAD